MSKIYKNNERKPIAVSNDVRIGLKVQHLVIESLQEYYDNRDIIETIDKYEVYDAYDKNGRKYEIKHRFNMYNKYKTTFIPVYKVNEIINTFDDDEDIKITFIFCFMDGSIYSIRYDKDIFDTFNIKNTFAERQNEILTNFEIPITELNYIDSIPSKLINRIHNKK